MKLLKRENMNLKKYIVLPVIALTGWGVVGMFERFSG